MILFAAAVLVFAALAVGGVALLANPADPLASPRPWGCGWCGHVCASQAEYLAHRCSCEHVR